MLLGMAEDALAKKLNVVVVGEDFALGRLDFHFHGIPRANPLTYSPSAEVKDEPPAAVPAEGKKGKKPARKRSHKKNKPLHR
jgi:hypothetical protein